MDRRIAFVVAFFFVGAFAGCAHSPVEKQEATAESLAGLRDTMRDTRSQIDKTVASLNAVLTAPESNLRDAYKRFADDVDTTTKQTARLDAEAAQMQKRSDAWLSTWQKTYGEVKNPELKSVSDQRREQVLNNFQRIQGSLIAARQESMPFVQNLQDIRKVLSVDLTPQAVQRLSSTAVVRNANDAGNRAARGLDVAIADLQNLIASLTPPPTG